ncbi:flagellar biosynthetic protein FliR [Agilicoccus flavus]|uniref:flagellar biosynthetic protein FliR n=1 Tax=Agilicoccus flavus TaxID=2775968 RepID=UPI001CF6FB83|nr:flagellar biosynthetic protein FliR [Agilicoccus flavus]
MSGTAPLDLLMAVLLVFTRISAFLVLAPPFASRSIPGRIRVLFAFALALPVAPLVVGQVPELTSTWVLVGAVGFQVLCGATMGFITLLLVSAIQAAGELIDLFSMFAMASMLDPFSNTNSSIFGRIQYLIGTTLLFTSGGHLLMIRGALSSFKVLPDVPPDLGALAKLLIDDIARMSVSAVEIAGPVLACLFLADLALGMVSRAVPSLNVFQLSFPVKTILTVSLAAVAVALLPVAVTGIVDQVVGQYQPALVMLGG